MCETAYFTAEQSSISHVNIIKIVMNLHRKFVWLHTTFIPVTS
jgi:hypothetical protein